MPHPEQHGTTADGLTGLALPDGTIGDDDEGFLAVTKEDLFADEFLAG